MNKEKRDILKKAIKAREREQMGQLRTYEQEMVRENVVLNARAVSIKGLQGRAVEVFTVGKWRGVANCGTHGLPSTKITAKAIRTVMFNTGSYDSYYADPENEKGFHTTFNPSKGTFRGKHIVLRWVFIENIIPAKK